MRKFTFLILSVALIATSSCKKACVVCKAVNDKQVLVNQSNTVCEANPNRKNFEDRYKEQFKSLTVTCTESE
ncbi:MAG: hypothetical protein U0T73_00865 [Chitinophagales bacterium]